jgi:hypothetical protein
MNARRFTATLPLGAPLNRLACTHDSSSNARDVAERSNVHGTGAADPDDVDGVVSTLYHALRGARAFDRYVGDAVTAGDAELERFFRACRTEEHARVRRAKSLLLARLHERAGDPGLLEDPDPTSGGEATERGDD